MSDSTALISDQLQAHLSRFAIPKKIKQGENLSVSHLFGSSKSLFLNILTSFDNQAVLAIFPEEETAEAVADECMTLFGEENVSLFPKSDRAGSAWVGLHARQSGQRMEVLRDLLNGQLRLVIAGANGLTEKLPSAEIMRSQSLQIIKGGDHDLNNLVEILSGFGYIRETMVERPGEISVRGGILDIFPLTGEAPHRIEFFGNIVDSIRSFDIVSQRSTGQSDSLHLISALRADNTSSQYLLDYFNTAPRLFIEDPDLVMAIAEKEIPEGAHSYTPDEIKIRLSHVQTISHHRINAPDHCLKLGIRSVKQLGRSPKDIRKRISAIARSGKVMLLSNPPSQTERLEEFLDIDETPISNLSIRPGLLRDGFELPDMKFTVLTQSSLFGRQFRRRRIRRFEKSSVPVRELSALNKGDFVVHIDYGIGVYTGLKKITVRSTERECLAIRYQDDDMLYVPVDKMERVQKYSGKDGAKPELYKLGTQKWENVKNRTKKEVERIANDLVQLYSARKLVKGLSFSPDTVWQRELEASFPYEETPDQERAILEIKADMENLSPMDRLLCGDVGYGKTEVAIRAAFKAVNDNKQVAVLVPTTILAQQHYETFRDRLRAFPVTVEMLSRFRSRHEQEEILNQCKTGKVDILIGTHRLLSKDVGFRDLGLLIIDEEQKFGVKHKEKLKALRTNVDVLALSATPIPRTLNLSLVGIRDMSMIHTPPVDRMPIHTEVLPFNESVIIEAIEYELDRQGQIFFVHNRIQSIHAVSDMIKKLVPGLRVAVAHGQMNTHELENVMHDFIQKKFDCLVATMIVGSGLDMPNVNTLLVNRADRLGLSQLYQLRGRVGRSDQKAYAYLFTPPLGLLSQDALKRLQTIEEFTELGAGFQIAMRDLEIRGAGNLLGYQQSGYIDAVGFELYTRLVAEAVEEIKAQSDHRAVAVRIPVVQCLADIDSDSYLPDDYIREEGLRVDLYRRLSACASPKELLSIHEELKDRFGPLPEAAETLIGTMQLQILGSARFIEQIRIEGPAMRCFFHETFADQFESSERLGDHLRSINEKSEWPVQFLSKHGLGLQVNFPKTHVLDHAKKWLQSWG